MDIRLTGLASQAVSELGTAQPQIVSFLYYRVMYLNEDNVLYLWVYREEDEMSPRGMARWSF